MREFWKKTIQVLLYGGLEKEQYKRISAEINEANRKALWCCQHTNKIIFMGAILLFGMFGIL